MIELELANRDYQISIRSPVVIKRVPLETMKLPWKDKDGNDLENWYQKHGIKPTEERDRSFPMAIMALPKGFVFRWVNDTDREIAEVAAVAGPYSQTSERILSARGEPILYYAHYHADEDYIGDHDRIWVVPLV